ncbi:hypothetical protein [Methyloversatilis thermotolerans]|uniref:hypothetical protein n=1 Tax=Methyloversatilis thermotolerans TaxID=1346290 RepID=UPI000371F067|nr:hypothetical protein [Methyloversatilis thermotolerans]
MKRPTDTFIPASRVPPPQRAGAFWRLRLLAGCAALAIVCCAPAQADDAPAAPPQPTGAVIPPTMDLTRPAGSSDEPATPEPATQPAGDGAAPPAAAKPAIAGITPDVIAPRPFGYVIGDVLAQRIALDADGRPVTVSKLPPLERDGNWFERRTAVIEHDDAGRGWLRIEYQVVNVPEELRTLELPALDLAIGDGTRRLQVPPLPVTVAPLTPTVVLARAGLEEMRPDLPVPHADAVTPMRRLNAALAVGVALLALWLLLLAVRRMWALRSLPFARATQDLKRTRDDAEVSWRRLHRAVDETAGQVIRSDDVGLLLARAPWLTPMEAELRQFFAASQAFFFGGRTEAGVDARALCARAARLERKALA